MGKVTGFLEWARAEPHRRPIVDRLRDWREVELPDEPAESRKQGGRCMDCGVPFCTQGCPLGNPIPDFAHGVWTDRWRNAHDQLAVTNEFPEFTGRLCPAPCEAACVLAIDDAPVTIASPGFAGASSSAAGGAVTSASPGFAGASSSAAGGAVTSASPGFAGASSSAAGGAVTSASPGFAGASSSAAGGAVTIEHLERAIIERAFAEGWVTARPPAKRTGKRVAVVGSGPAGLAAAAHLNRAGHRVVVFESAASPGGLLRYGIPDFKMEKHVIDRRLAILAAEGVEVRCNVAVGKEPTWKQLRADHDAVVIAIGAQRARDLEVPGRNLDGVLLAMDYLTEQNEVVAGQRPASRFDVRGKRVIILGGGDTGSDCLGTALRQGAAHVTQIELMPQPPIARPAQNPWPSWPFVFRTSSSQEEGGDRTFAFRTTLLEGDAGRLVALRGVKVDDPSGQAGEIRLPVDTLILALGFTGPDATPLVEQLGVSLDTRHNIVVDKQFATNVKGVFCAGDAHRGASLIVWAIAEGRDTAKAVDAFLRG